MKKLILALATASVMTLGATTTAQAATLPTHVSQCAAAIAAQQADYERHRAAYQRATVWTKQVLQARMVLAYVELTNVLNRCEDLGY